MEILWIQIIVLVLFGGLLYREILQSAKKADSVQRSKAGFGSIILISLLVALFTYIGMSITLVQTKDLRPFTTPTQNHGEWVSLYDKGVIELNGMLIKTNLAKPGELTKLSASLVEDCHGNDGCEAQKLFDYVTALKYKTDYTSRNANEVVRSGWGDCDDKSNLFASLLNERQIPYVFVYVPHHVFVAVHIQDKSAVPFINASLVIKEKRYFYAETTASGSKIGEFNGQFPSAYEGIYDLSEHQEIDLKDAAFRLF